MISSALVACATNIRNVRFYREIPFLDAPEGAFVDSVNHTEGLMSAAEWAKAKPFMTCIDPQGVRDILTMWYEACRGAKTCNVPIDSVRELVVILDQIAAGMLNPPAGSHP